MSSAHILDPYVIALIVEEGKTYLEIGGGYGKWPYLMKISHKPPSIIVGGDIDKDAIMFVKEHRTYDHSLFFDARYVPFRDNSFDTVLCLEVIEHIEKEAADLVFSDSERVAREKVIVSTPLLGANYWYKDNYHISRWTPGDLSKRGFTVRGVGFSLFGRWTTEKLVFGLAPLAYYFPWLSFIMLATKIVDNKNK